MKLKDKVAIVTGGSNGIGRAIAISLAKEGAHVVVADIDKENADIVVDQIKELGRKALAVKMDVTQSQEVKKVISNVLVEFHKIDILVNNAGGGPDPQSKTPFPYFYQSNLEDCDKVIALNLSAVLYCCRAVVNHMMERHGGKIINIASAAGIIGATKLADYSAAKAGVIGFSMALAKEVGSDGINVNCVSPGPIVTSNYPKTSDIWERRRQMMALRRFGKPEDIANMVTYLASDEASFITGQNYSVCGGRSLGLEVD